jgi:hypothetical protein
MLDAVGWALSAAFGIEAWLARHPGAECVHAAVKLQRTKKKWLKHVDSNLGL